MESSSKNAYMQDWGYHHLTVNYRLNFVDLDTRVHPQDAEINCTGTSKDLFESFLQQWFLASAMPK